MLTSLSTPPALTPIFKIQGRGAISPMAGEAVRSSGIVTGVFTYVSSKGIDSSGLYVQDATGDGDAATSDGLFVLTPEARKFKVGDSVETSGTVEERYGMTSITHAQVSASGARQPVPAPVALKIAADQASGEAALEALEGMRVTLPNAMAMGGSTSFGYAATDSARQGARRRIDGVPSSQVIDVSADLGIATAVKTGDRISKVEGPLVFAFGGWRLLQTARSATVTPSAAPPKQWGDVDGDDRITPTDVKAITAAAGTKVTDLNDARDLDANGTITAADAALADARSKLRTGAPTFRVANFNVENLFDTVDDPNIGNEIVMSRSDYRAKLTGIARTIVGTLGSPSIVTLEEVENATVLRDLVARPELAKRGYKFAHIEGIDPRGIDVAFLYRGDSVSVENVRQVQGESTLVGKDDISDTGETKALFMRPPLLAEVTVKDASGVKQEFTLITNHFMSKYSPSGRPTDPWRIQQATFTRDLVEKLRREHPNRGVMVAGDLNDNDTSEMQRILTGKGSPLADIGQTFVPPAERYTYNFKGTAQAIDHLLVTSDLLSQVEAAGVHHVNTDLPEADTAGTPTRITDHDLLYTELRFPAAKP